MLLTYPKQLLVFEKCALSDLKYGHVIDSEASDSLRVTWVAQGALVHKGNVVSVKGR